MAAGYKCVVLLLLASLIAVQAQIPNVGWCPDYLPMTDFDMSRFLGKWYEAERYFTFTEVVSRCVVTDYAKAPSGRIYVSNEVTNRLTGVKRIINGNMQLVGKGDEGKIHVKYATTPIPTEATLTVLETDYDNYAVVWSCNGFGPIHTQNAWLMTRERLPSGNVLQKAYGILDKFKISRTFFVKTDQEGCYLAASDINAANGITAQSTVPEYTGSDQRDDEGLRSAGVLETEKEIPLKQDETKKEEVIDTTKEQLKQLLQEEIKEEIPKQEKVIEKLPEIIEKEKIPETVSEKEKEKEIIKETKPIVPIVDQDKKPIKEQEKIKIIDAKIPIVIELEKNKLETETKIVSIPEHILKKEDVQIDNIVKS